MSADASTSASPNTVEVVAPNTAPTPLYSTLANSGVLSVLLRTSTTHISREVGSDMRSVIVRLVLSLLHNHGNHFDAVLCICVCVLCVCVCVCLYMCVCECE